MLITKLVLPLFISVMFFTACAHQKTTTKDKFSGTCWNSKFEACMDDLEGTLVFYRGTVYLYNNWHGTHKSLGTYQLIGEDAFMPLYMNNKADITFHIKPDSKLEVGMPKVIRGMGPESYKCADKLPWSFERRSDSKFMTRVNEVIFKSESNNQTPNQSPEPTTLPVTPRAPSSMSRAK